MLTSEPVIMRWLLCSESVEYAREDSDYQGEGKRNDAVFGLVNTAIALSLPLDDSV